MKAKNHVAKKILSFVLSALLIFNCAYFLCACNKPKPTVQKGITISGEQKPEYSAETKNFATSSINGFLTEIFALYFNNNVPKATAEKLPTITANVQTIIERVGISQDNYLKILNSLNKWTNEENVNKNEELKGLYAQITATLGVSETAGIIFDLADYYFDFKYDEFTSDYERLGWASLKADADKMAENKRILTEEIKKEKFIPLTEMLYFVGELFFGGAFENSILSTFTTQEILQFIKFPDFSELSLTDSGWKLILTVFKPIFASSNLQKRMFSAMETNGDLLSIAKKMNGVTEFINSVQSAFTLEQAELVKNGDTERFINVLFASLSQSQWNTLQNVFDVQLNNHAYNELAKNEYGAVYTNYVNGLVARSFDDVKEASTTENFIPVFKNFIKGVCPAFSYEVEK